MRRILAVLFFLLCAAPAFSNDFQYVNQETVSFKGTAQSGTTIIIYVNGTEVQRLKPDQSGQWRASNIRLDREGENIVYAKAVDADGNESNSSKVLRLILDRTRAEVVVRVLPEKVRPRETLSIKVTLNKNASQVHVALPNGEVQKLVYNKDSGLWEGNWKIPSDISSGTFTLVAVATDQAGNTAQGPSNAFDIVADRKLSILKPLDGELTYDQKITVQGLAESTEFVIIKGQQVPVDSDNRFQYVADLDQFGQNTLDVASYSSLGLSQKATVSVVRLVTFPDIKDSNVRSEIEFLATLGFVSGLPDSEIFGPDYKISREEAVRILVLAGRNELYDPKLSTYKDVKRSNEAYHYIESATSSGLAFGYPKGVFRPKSYLTRAEAVALLVRFAGDNAVTRGRAEAMDMPVSHWATKYLSTVKKLNMLPPQWRDSPRFYPGELITRAEFAAILARVPNIRRRIAALIKRDPNFELITHAFVTDSQDQPRSVETEEANRPKRYPLIESSLSATHILRTEALPSGVYQGSVLKIYVNSLRKMRRVTLFMPDHRQYVMNFDATLGRYARTLTMDADTYPPDLYTYEVLGEDEQGQQFLIKSNPFEVLAYQAYTDRLKTQLSSQLDPVIVFPEFEGTPPTQRKPEQKKPEEEPVPPVSQDGFVYPENYGQVKSTQTPANPPQSKTKQTPPAKKISRDSVKTKPLVQPPVALANEKPGVSLSRRLQAMLALRLLPVDGQGDFQGGYVMTRNKAVYYVAKPLGLAHGKLIFKPARDVGPQDSYAYAIQQAINRGWLTTVSGGYFRPHSALTQKQAYAMLMKLGMPKRIGSDQPITQADFFEAFSYVPAIKAKVDPYLGENK